MPSPRILPRNPRAVLLTNPYCEPLRAMYRQLERSGATSWNQVEAAYRRRAGIPTAYELERVLYRACIELQGLRTAPPPPIPHDVPPSAATEAVALTEEATDER